MNGKKEDEIQAALQRGIDWVRARGEEYHSPYNSDNVTFNEKNEVHDPKPIAMLAKAIEQMDECTGVLFIGDLCVLYGSRGCSVESLIARTYGMEREKID